MTRRGDETTHDRSPDRRGPGRPQQRDASGVPTRDRLLAAATEACIECGFEGVTVADIARRAGVSTPGVYNHFASKSELMVEACQVALRRLAPTDDAAPDPRAVVRRYLSPDFADARILQIEVNLASQRHADLRDLMAKWHGDAATTWAAGHQADPATVKTWYLFLLGLSQLDGLASLDAHPDALEAAATRMVDALFEPPSGDPAP